MPEAERLELRHATGVTELAVGRGRELAGAALAGWAAGRAVFVVTSAPIWELHGRACLDAVAEVASSFEVLAVPDGEAAKTPEVAAGLWQRILAGGGKRDSRVVTFGGGAVGDVGGFVAGTYMRGVPLAHVPTTLLAQVDAAVGGKAAISLPGAKNAVGVFHHPRHVVAATAVLETLPPRQLKAGLVEVVKAAALLDPRLFAELERSLDGLLAAGADRVGLVAAAQRAKIGVVERDPEEHGERRVLNFGHTLGHALEASLPPGALLHGEAVAYGMAFATALARRRGLEAGFERRLGGLLARLDPPPLPACAVAPLLRCIERDKKARHDGPVWVLPTGVGAWEAARLPRSEVADALAAFVESPAAC
ncbi:MAG: 3-dehydroquinate synthase [Acidobacteriota bacterium]|nr:3-dehydroquinate synthase [Acidobacteriota bacterium]MDH3522216.1 3-dehydroquinate synthase [Acidobacteriota bacterium]